MPKTIKTSKQTNSKERIQEDKDAKQLQKWARNPELVPPAVLLYLDENLPNWRTC